MLVKVVTGEGRPGKLWRGSLDFFGMKEDQSGGVVLDDSFLGVQYYSAELVENWSESGATTRRLFGHKAEVSEAAAAALEIPTLYVSAGGVASVGDGVAETRTWNWSGRTSGHVILNPLMVHNAKEWELKSSPLTTPKQGFAWIETYYGTTIREHVLVKLGEDGNIHPDHLMPCIRWHQATLSPPEKRAAEEAAELVDTAEADDQAARVS